MRTEGLFFRLCAVLVVLLLVVDQSRVFSLYNADRVPAVENCDTLPNICDQLKRDIATLKESTRGYIRAGLPHYFDFFGRDSLWTALELLGYDPNIARDTCNELARYQGKYSFWHNEQPGKIIHFVKPGVPFTRLYYSIDSTPLFVYVCGQYFEKTGDIKWLRKIWPHIERALVWCANDGDFDRDLFIEYKNNSHMFHQGWKDGDADHLHILPPVKLVEVQAYYYAALREAAKMALALGQKEAAATYSWRAEKLQKAFITKFWLPDRKIFAFAIDGNGVADGRVVSNMGQILFSGILDGDEYKDKRDAIVAAMFSPGTWTEYGIRTHSTANSDFDAESYHMGSIWPHDNWIIAQGLKRYGYVNQYEAVKSAQLKAFRAFHGIPELYVVEKGGRLKPYPDACMPQAWSSGGLLNFLLEKYPN